MKHYLKYSLVFILFLWIGQSYAQVTITNKGTWIVNSHSDIYIKGNYVNETDNRDSSGAIANGGNIYINGNITNNARNHIFLTNAGKVVLNGNIPQAISGDSSIYFNKLDIANTSGDIQLKQNIQVRDTLTFISGNINLDTNSINLGKSGYFKGENSSRRVYGTGIIKAVRFITPPIFDSTLAGLGMNISAPTADYGYTLIERSEQRQYNHTDTSINRYYLFAPENPAITGVINTLTVNYFPQEFINGEPERNYKIFGSIDGGNTWLNKGGLVDTVNHLVKTSVLSSNLNPVSTILLTVFSSKSFNTCDSTNPNYLRAEFLLQSQKVQLGDTIGLTQLTEPTATSYSWMFGDGGTSTLPSPDYIYQKDTNTYLIIMTATNGYCSDTKEKWIIVGNRTNLPDSNTTNSIQVYHDPLVVSVQPNPNNGFCNLSIQSDSTSGTIDVFNSIGKPVLHDTFATNNPTINYNFSSLSGGMYLFRVESGGNVRVFRAVME